MYHTVNYWRVKRLISLSKNGLAVTMRKLADFQGNSKRGKILYKM